MAHKTAIIIFCLIFLLVPQSLFAQVDNSFALINGFLVDGNGGGPIKDSVIIVADNTITMVGTGHQVTIPKNIMRIDLKGKTVLPGFFNSHVHRAYDERKLKKWASSGVTTIRDLGIISNTNVATRDLLMKDNKNARSVASEEIAGA